MPRIEARSAAAVAALLGGLFFGGGACSGSRARVAPPQGGIAVDPSMLARLLGEEDCDGDKRITVRDLELAKRGDGACRANAEFDVPISGDADYRLSGTFRLSRLSTELELARRAGRT